MHMWIIFSLLAPLCWAAVNFIDENLVNKEKATGAAVIFSAVFGAIASLVIFLFFPEVLGVSVHDAVLYMFTGVAFMGMVICYLYALDSADKINSEYTVSLVVPWFELSTPIGILLAFALLGETITWIQGGAIAIIFIGAILLNTDFKVFRFYKGVAIKMLGAAFFFAVGRTLYKFVAGGTESFWTASFWENIGIFLVALILFVLIRNYRKDFIGVFKNSRKKVMGLSAANESISTVGNLIGAYATLIAPIGVVFAIFSIQSLYIVIFESIKAKEFGWNNAQTILSILMIIAGAGLLALVSN